MDDAGVRLNIKPNQTCDSFSHETLVCRPKICKLRLDFDFRAKNLVSSAGMFGLVSGLVEQFFASPEYAVLIVGLDDAGKTVQKRR